jgi:hypothetical protein
MSAVAYGAVAVSSMRLLVEARRAHGGFFLCLDQKTLNKLMASKRSSEDFSDMLIRMAKAEVTVPNRSPVAVPLGLRVTRNHCPVRTQEVGRRGACV